ncbi:DUF917 family protein [Acidianus infernus]|uniref:DUF917 family protein n=2 Tax=Acidianus infernus TaxID=12915 RepID=A0A6A9QGH6_ACIIN|nr:DUF917 domain-containing protein [Acidianus infernus]MUM64883.1 DUF917 family protein [Acidianus infernus]
MRFYINDLYKLAIGSAILGSGGGGNPFLGYKLLKAKMLEYNLSYVETTDDIDDSDFIIGVGGMGSPLIGIEKLPAGYEYYNSMLILSKFMRKRFTKISPIEIGGINSLVPFMASIFAKVPVIDGDYEGRAFPELYMTTMHFSGFSATPMAITDERGNYAIISTADNLLAEKIARDITVRFGGRGYISIYPTNGEDYTKGAILGSVSLAYEIGNKLAEEGLDEMLSYANGRIVFQGKIIDVRKFNVSGFNIGFISLEGLEEFKGSTATIIFKNEYLCFVKDSKCEVLSPEIITLLDYNHRNVITSDSLKYGLKVVVVTISVDKKWREIGGYEIMQKIVMNEIKRILPLPSP